MVRKRSDDINKGQQQNIVPFDYVGRHNNRLNHDEATTIAYGCDSDEWWCSRRRHQLGRDQRRRTCDARRHEHAKPKDRRSSSPPTMIYHSSTLTALDIAHIHYSCHHTLHACQTPTLLHAGAVQRGGPGAAPSKNSGLPVPPIKFMIKHNLPVVRCGSLWQYRSVPPPAAIMATPLPPAPKCKPQNRHWLHECFIKTNIRHITLELLLCLLLLCISGVRSVMPLINEDWLIDWLIDQRFYTPLYSVQHIAKLIHGLHNQLIA